ncbi:MAG: hypothetical protein ACYC56_01805 [Candidatus Aquicultor sp.]
MAWDQSAVRICSALKRRKLNEFDTTETELNASAPTATGISMAL